MTPEEAELLQQLEFATSAQRSDFADTESAALGDGWRVLHQTLQPIASTPLSPALAAALTASLTRQTNNAAKRRVSLRRTVWAVAAVVVIACSVIAFRADPVSTIQVVEPSVEPKPQPSLPTVPKQDTFQSVVDEYPVEPVIVETQARPAWEGVDTELTELSAKVDDLRRDWRLTPSYLDYVARRFEQLEYELAVTKL